MYIERCMHHLGFSPVPELKRGTSKGAQDGVSDSQTKIFPRCKFRVAETGRAGGAGEWTLWVMAIKFSRLSYRDALMTLKFTRGPRLNSSCYHLTATVSWVGGQFSIAAARGDKWNGMEQGLSNGNHPETANQRQAYCWAGHH